MPKPLSSHNHLVESTELTCLNSVDWCFGKWEPIGGFFSPPTSVISSGYSVSAACIKDITPLLKTVIFPACFFPFFLQGWRWKSAGLSFLKCLALRVCCTKCHTLTTALSKEMLLHIFCYVLFVPWFPGVRSLFVLRDCIPYFFLEEF